MWWFFFRPQCLTLEVTSLNKSIEVLTTVKIKQNVKKQLKQMIVDGLAIVIFKVYSYSLGGVHLQINKGISTKSP